MRNQILFSLKFSNFRSAKGFMCVVASLYAMFPKTSDAGIYLEPYVGYQLGSEKGRVNYELSSVAGTTNVNYDTSGLQYGGKLGYSIAILAIGADYQTGTVHEKDKNASPTDTSSEAKSIGPFVSVSVPLLKFNATYFVSTTFTSKESDSEGKGYKVGLGLTFLPLVSINFDYFSYTYDKGKIKTSGFTTRNVDITHSGYMVGLSLPLDF